MSPEPTTLPDMSTSSSVSCTAAISCCRIVCWLSSVETGFPSS